MPTITSPFIGRQALMLVYTCYTLKPACNLPKPELDSEIIVNGIPNFGKTEPNGKP